jgi:hypothetical protein
MKIKQTFPKGFVPYEVVNFCSNTLINVLAIIGVNDTPYLLVGKGDVPMIWLYTQDENGRRQPLIEKNVTKNPQIKVDIKGEEKRICFSYEGKLLIEALGDPSSVCTIESIDLTNVGININGTYSSLFIAGTTYAGNTFSNTKYMIG